jgi:hypothetical protein
MAKAEEIAEDLNKRLPGYVAKALKNVGYAEPYVKTKLNGRVEFSYGEIPFDVVFCSNEFQQVRVCVRRKISNGLLQKAGEKAELSGKTLEEEIIEMAREKLNEVKSNSQLRREKGYFQDRKIFYDESKEDIEVECKIRRIPKEEKDFRSLFNDWWGIFARPLIRLGK